MGSLFKLAAVTLAIVLVTGGVAMAFGNAAQSRTRARTCVADGQDRARDRDRLQDGSCKVADGQDQVRDRDRDRDQLRDGSCKVVDGQDQIRLRDRDPLRDGSCQTAAA